MVSCTACQYEFIPLWNRTDSSTPDEKPEIEPHFWDIKNLKWPVSGKTKPDLIIFDPPYFSKKAKEYEEAAILIIDYGNLMRKAGWAVSHVMQAPMSSERFQGGTVSAMQNKKILGVTSRYVIVGKKTG